MEARWRALNCLEDRQERYKIGTKFRDVALISSSEPRRDAAMRSWMIAATTSIALVARIAAEEADKLEVSRERPQSRRNHAMLGIACERFERDPETARHGSGERPRLVAADDPTERRWPARPRRAGVPRSTRSLALNDASTARRWRRALGAAMPLWAALGCGGGTGEPSVVAAPPDPPASVAPEAPPAPPAAARDPPPGPPAARHPLDRTSWRCGDLTSWAFWGDHLLEIDKDPALVAMRAHAVTQRTDYALAYVDDGFTLAARRREDVRAGRPAEEVAGPTYTFRHTLRGERMTVTGPSLDEPLECVRRCFDEAFMRNMDARYGTRTDPSVLCDEANGP
ncbi:hypothetical protein [Nannocystis radixulma]|uniref:Lipoprotein n=1 Tax=Nannocystis radixulma TaxID=2995305 RepID=A0ABT5BDJ9_9BACT|nr:hypothetical protein [Nannocystis radixulma]MDC0672227.1 hypothetical protein [Nannocystis radixulma]